MTSGPVAKRIALNEQLAMRGRGDLARRMGLHGPPDGRKVRSGRHPHHGHRPIIDVRYAHQGRISPRYGQYHFRSHCRWPSYYASFYSRPGFRWHWCPRWSPWVNWTWYYRCPLVIDPRPVYCRPLVYVGCSDWVWWDQPVWEPLPVVACGTWVDVAPAPVPVRRVDLQLLAVRFVDAGHPEERLGPRYRVWFRNNSAEAIFQPFTVTLLASNDENVAAGVPVAGVRVTGIEAGQTQSVDIRLPFEVQQMGRDQQGQPVPFSMLHVLVDSGREIDETSEINNGSRLAAELVMPVDPSVFDVKPNPAECGNELLVAGEGLGPEPGRVLINLAGLELDAEIVGWYDLGVCIKMPPLPLAEPVEMQVVVIRRDGVATNPLVITVKPQGAAAQGPEMVPPAALP